MQLTSGVGALLLPRERMASVPETTPHASPHLLRVEPLAHCPADVLGLSVDVVWACQLLGVARALRNTWGSMAAHAGPRSSAPPVPVRDLPPFPHPPPFLQRATVVRRDDIRGLL